MEFVYAVTFIRKMRGGAQSFLIEASDGSSYVIKSVSNPQGRRTLINEWVGSHVLAKLGVKTAPIRPIYLSSEWLMANRNSCPRFEGAGCGIQPDIQPGFHLGCLYVGNPASTPVYDFLPGPLFTCLTNLSDFTGALIADKWLGNTDKRQCVFHRGKTSRLEATMIDHGFVFDGCHWEFRDSPLFGRYFDNSVYDGVRTWDAFAPWIERVQTLDGSYLHGLFQGVPAEWLDNDALEVPCLIDSLMRRQTRLLSLIEQMRDTAQSPFRNWVQV